MAFTFTQARRLSPEEANPMNALISRAMESFGKGINLSYLPREKEAGIFSKEISPLAALASNPNFTGFNPAIQKQIVSRIGQYLQNNRGSNQGMFSQGDSRDLGNQQEQGDETSSIFGDNKRNQLTQEQTAPLRVHQENGKKVISPSANTRGQAESATVSGAKTQGLIKSIADNVRSIGKHGKWQDYISDAALRAEGADVPILQMLVPSVLRQSQKDLEASLINNWNYTKDQAHSATQKGLNESNEGFAKRIETLGKDLSKQGKHLRKSVRNQVSLEDEDFGNNDGSSVLMMTPDGKQWFVPANKIQDAQKLGAKEVQ